MTALALSPNPSLGLEHLVAQADNLSSDAPKETWDSWIQATMLALETDDSVDSRLTDQLGETKIVGSELTLLGLLPFVLGRV